MSKDNYKELKEKLEKDFYKHWLEDSFHLWVWNFILKVIIPSVEKETTKKCKKKMGKVYMKGFEDGTNRDKPASQDSLKDVSKILNQSGGCGGSNKHTKTGGLGGGGCGSSKIRDDTSFAKGIISGRKQIRKEIIKHFDKESKYMGDKEFWSTKRIKEEIKQL